MNVCKMDFSPPDLRFGSISDLCSKITVHTHDKSFVIKCIFVFKINKMKIINTDSILLVM